MVSANHIRTAYRKLKRLVYYDKTDLCLRQRLAVFECSPEFENRLRAVEKLLNSRSPASHPRFKTWLNEISFRLVPKSLNKEGSPIASVERGGRFLSNVTSANTIEVEKVNYFFDGPIELHLIAVLWIMFEGCLLDSHLGPECCGSRLQQEVGKGDDVSAELFVRYHELYARWRDTGIKKAKQLLAEDQKNVCILGLDVQQYFYQIRLNFDELADFIRKARLKKDEDEDTLLTERYEPSELLTCLREIYAAYRAKIAPHLQQTQKHNDVPPLNTGIPIGICSSLILANWYLRDFDIAVKTHLRPAYYGRYVDDILIVVATPDDPSKEGPQNPVAAFMDRVLVRSGILRELKDDRYEIAKPGRLFLQQDKCILQYFDVKHSIAGLEKFQKKLEANGSDFLLLPVDEGDNSLEEVAYELLYEGSVNKFRSVKGMAENRYELAKHLARQTILHLLTDEPANPETSRGLQRFFKGRNGIEFYDLWERVFTFFRVANDKQAALAFAKQLLAEIGRVRYKRNHSVGRLLSTHLLRHFELCRAMSDALEQDICDLDSDTDCFRRANLIRHHFIRMPLLNYTNYTGSLLARNVDEKLEIAPKSQKYSPRFVNFDECVLLANSGVVNIGQSSPFSWAMEVYEAINGHTPEGMEWIDAQADRRGVQ